MKKLYWVLALWLGCTPVGWAWQDTPEVLTYNVRWGMAYLGRAQLAFTPQGNTYALEARVKDSVPFIEIDNVWRTEGKLTEDGWRPATHHMLQRENDYRADKLLTFNGNEVLYQNRIGSEPDLTVALDGARDALSTLYNLRAGGLEVLPQARTIPVMGVKRTFPMEIKAAVRDGDMWLVEMYAHDPIKQRMDRWRLWLRDEPALTPVKIEARTPLGTLVATLTETRK